MAIDIVPELIGCMGDHVVERPSTWGFPLIAALISAFWMSDIIAKPRVENLHVVVFAGSQRTGGTR